MPDPYAADKQYSSGMEMGAQKLAKKYKVQMQAMKAAIDLYVFVQSNMAPGKADVLLKDIAKLAKHQTQMREDEKYERQYHKGKHRSKAGKLAVDRARATDKGRSMSNYDMMNYRSRMMHYAGKQFDRANPY